MKPTNRITIMIADDHPVFRKGLRELIAEEKRFVVVAETGDGDRVLEMIRQLKPSVVLLDLNMPGTSGLDIAASLRDEELPARVIVLTMHKEEAIFNKVMDLGVSGYVLKESAIQDIFDSILAAVNDDYYISPAISQYLIKRRAGAASLQRSHPGLEQLTSAERRILRLIGEDKTSKEISEQLFLSVRTVEN